MKHVQFYRNFLKYTALILLFTLFFSESASATNIQKLFETLKEGDRVQIKVFKNSAGELVADRIQVDKSLSKPKIRAAIQSLNQSENIIEILGLKVKIKETTETDLKKTVNPMEVLKPGQRVEVKIRVQDDSTLKATRLTTKKIKPSDKIEAFIQGKIKGVSGFFYLKVLGLKIKVDSGTDLIAEVSESYSPLDKRLVDVDESRSISPIVLQNFLVVEGGVEWNLTPERNYQRYQLNNGLNDLDDNMLLTGVLMDLELTGKYHKNVESFTKVRFFGNHPLSIENRIEPDRGGNLQLREAYLLYRDILNLPFGVKVGRQDFDETREWIFDHNLDAARLYFYPVRGLVSEFSYAIGSLPETKKFEKIREIIFHSNWEYIKNHNFGIWFLDRDDKSDSIVAGRPQETKPRWYGLRANGKYRTMPVLFRYWSEFSWLRGDRLDKGRKFEAYAFDIGNTFALNSWWEPSVTFGYAFGSGGKTPTTITTFEQTGYHDNTDNFNGVATFQYYGEIFDPELSNLKIFTFGAGLKPTSILSLDLIYHRYKQVEPVDFPNELKDTDLIDPVLLPTPFWSPDLGWETDFVTGIEKLRNFDIKLVISYFKPGDAFFFKDSSTWHSRLAVEFNF